MMSCGELSGRLARSSAFSSTGCRMEPISFSNLSSESGRGSGSSSSAHRYRLNAVTFSASRLMSRPVIWSIKICRISERRGRRPDARQCSAISLLNASTRNTPPPTAGSSTRARAGVVLRTALKAPSTTISASLRGVKWMLVSLASSGINW